MKQFASRKSLVQFIMMSVTVHSGTSSKNIEHMYLGRDTYLLPYMGMRYVVCRYLHN